MLSKTTKTLLFLSSYAPLFAILGIRLAPSLASYILWGITLISIIFTLLFFKWIVRNISTYSVNIKELNSQGEVIAFVITYIIPFITFNEKAWQEWTSTALLLIVIAVLYVNSPLIHTNPVLALFGWHTYEIMTTSGKRMLMTKKTYATTPPCLKVITIGDNILLEVNDDSGTNSAAT